MSKSYIHSFEFVFVIQYIEYIFFCGKFCINENIFDISSVSRVENFIRTYILKSNSEKNKEEG